MSCGSTTRTTRYHAPALKELAGFERLGGPSAWLARFNDGFERRCQRRQLLELDDHLLADIGLSPEHAVEKACMSSWLRVTRWIYP
jgi:hypothetical protein